MATGAYVRVKRGARWVSLEIDQLTDEELDEWIAMSNPEDGWKWAKFLAAWVRDHVASDDKKHDQFPTHN